MAWQISNRGTVGAAAIAAAAASGNTTYQARLRALQATLSGTAAGVGTLVVRDGASGVGTIIFRADLAMAANARDGLILTDMDLRASAGAALTVEFLAGTASDFQAVNAQGDYVAPGTPFGE